MANLTTVEDERKIVQYFKARDLPREVMAYGVYPNCKKALSDYDQLLLRLSDPNDLGEFVAYHATATAPVAEYVDQLYRLMLEICTIIEAVEKSAIKNTGVPLFGIQLGDADEQ